MVIRHILSLSVIALFGWTALYWYAPNYTADYLVGIPMIAELREAWVKYGIVDVDFTPFRCQGLPVFSSPTSLVWSLFHLFALVFNEFNAALAVYVFLGIASYFVCFQFLVESKLNSRWAALLSLGWALQGFMISRTLVSHLNYNLLGLAPLFLLYFMRERISFLLLLASAFVLAHAIYTTAVYFPMMVAAGVLITWLLMLILDRERDHALSQRRFGSVFLRGGLLVLTTGAMSFAKILGTLEFSALFPRYASLLDVPLWNSFVVNLSQQFFPFPWDIQSFAGWWYRNWEVYIFLFPGFIYVLLWKFVLNRRESWIARWLLAFLLLILIGTVTNSGMIKPVVQHIPLLNSLHVNPRWSALILIGLLAIFAWAIRRLRWELNWKLESVLWIVFAGLPFMYVDAKDMAILFPIEKTIQRDPGRSLICYEPMFGYQLENFPRAKSFNLLSEDMVDPRCYLRTNRCEPGVLFRDRPNGSELNRQLKSYELRDEQPVVVYGKLPSLMIYFAGFCSLLILLVHILREHSFFRRH